jgi:hypothetical protein
MGLCAGVFAPGTHGRVIDCLTRLPRFGALTVEPMNAASPAPTERELFDAAISLPAEAVDAYLQENCPDQSLRARIGALGTAAPGGTAR